MFGKSMPDWLKKAIENLQNSKIKPIFSGEVIVSSMLKAQKTEKGIKKEAHIVMAFLDMTNLQPVGKYVITVSTASGLINALKTQITNLDKEMESNEIPKGEKKITEPTAASESDLSYIG